MAKKALVVDDVPFVRKQIAQALSQAKVQVVGEAADGEEAVEMFKRLTPDFVTMDVVMPKKTGVEACRSIVEKHPEAKVIFISAMNHEQLQMDAINSGARDYILKPFSPEDLFRALEKLFGAESDDHDEELSTQLEALLGEEKG